MTLSVGELSYISGLPISLPFHAGWVESDGLSFRAGRPGELDAWMESGELAAGPISSLEYARRRDRYVLVPDLSIASWGRFGSTTLFAKGSFSRLGGQTIALPHAGATSNVLVQWLLQKMFGVEAQYEEAQGPLTEVLQTHPAALVIGDEGLIESRKNPELTQMDLGEAWWQMMKTPLVQTVWAIQASLGEAERQLLIERFTRAKEQGKVHHAEVVASATERLGIPAEEIEAYYALLNYDLAPVHQQSMRMFADFIQEVAPLR